MLIKIITPLLIFVVIFLWWPVLKSAYYAPSCPSDTSFLGENCAPVLKYEFDRLGGGYVFLQETFNTGTENFKQHTDYSIFALKSLEDPASLAEESFYFQPLWAITAGIAGAVISLVVLFVVEKYTRSKGKS